MSDYEKEKGDAEYRDGYDLGRDGDPGKRFMSGLLGFTDSSTTYGKGYKQGVEDRHAYGSRDSSQSLSAEPVIAESDSPNVDQRQEETSSYSGASIDTTYLATLLSPFFVIAGKPIVFILFDYAILRLGLHLALNHDGGLGGLFSVFLGVPIIILGFPAAIIAMMLNGLIGCEFIPMGGFLDIDGPACF